MIGDGGSGPLSSGGGESSLERGIPILAVGIILVYVVFVLRLFQLQITEGADLRARSERNSVRNIILEAPRGDILDREGRILATTRPAFGLQVMPVDVQKNKEKTFAALGQLLDADPQEYSQRVGNPQGRERFQAVRLADDLSYDRLARIESHSYALPGVMTDVQPRRAYVAGELAAHLLGQVGEIDGKQLASQEYRGYRRGEVVGKAGVETLMQAFLRGSAGGRNVVVDVAGRIIEVIDEVLPIPGGTATLTIDLDLQRVAEEAFLPPVLGELAKQGALVALDPRNGDVLALVSKPAYDPNLFAGGIDSETWTQLAEDSGRPIQNRAIAGQYPPGSTYKPFVAAAILEEGLIDPEEKIFCPGHFKLGRRTYRCWRRGGHGEVALHEALVKSCDVYFYQVGLRLGIDRLAHFAAGFNLGHKTRIPISHELPGLIPTSEWKERRFKEPWIRGETVSASIGQGFDLVTPVQLAVAYAALVNGGEVLQPRLVLKTRDRGGRVRRGPERAIVRKVPVSSGNLAVVRDALEGVVMESGGTGGRARVKGVRIGGKTGTSQVVALEHTEGMEEDEIARKYRDHAWFASFAPVEAPEIVVAVIVEHGGHGGSAAAPIAQKVMARYFEKKAAAEAAATLETAAAASRGQVASQASTASSYSIATRGQARGGN